MAFQAGVAPAALAADLLSAAHIVRVAVVPVVFPAVAAVPAAPAVGEGGRRHEFFGKQSSISKLKKKEVGGR